MSDLMIEVQGRPLSLSMTSSHVRLSSGYQSYDVQLPSHAPQTRMYSDNKLLVPARTWRQGHSGSSPTNRDICLHWHEDPDDEPHALGGHRGHHIRRLYDGNDKLSMTSGRTGTSGTCQPRRFDVGRGMRQR